MERSNAKRERLHILVDVLSRQGAMTRAALLAHPDLAKYYGPSADPTLRRDLAALAGRPFKSLASPTAPPSAQRAPHTHDVRYNRDTGEVLLLPSSASAPLSDDELALLETLAGSLRDDPLVGARLVEMLIRRCRAAPTPRNDLTLLALASDYSAHQEVVNKLLTFMRQGRAVNFDYQSATGERHFEEIDIAEVSLRDGHYYFYGYSHDGPDVQFRIDRIIPRTFRLHPRYGVPRRRRARSGVLVRYWLATELIARGVSDRLRDQQTAEVSDGVIVSGRAHNLFEVERLLLSYGPLARALDPPDLRAKMAENARRLAQLYAEDC